jgi:hydrogenase maturation protease
MSIKLLAIGNVLMEDDGIAIFLAAALEDRLHELGMEVIYGETDISYSISGINDGDIVFILDAAKQGITAGEVSLYNMEERKLDQGNIYGHNVSVMDLISRFYPECRCYILTVEVYEVDFHYGLSSCLMDMISDIAHKIIMKINMALFQK